MDFTLPGSGGLQIEYFSHLFDNTSECYKMFWFQVIVKKILAGQTSASYGEIIDEMIADAWYMVAEYHLNLGLRDNLEMIRANQGHSIPVDVKPDEKEPPEILYHGTGEKFRDGYNFHLSVNKVYCCSKCSICKKALKWPHDNKVEHTVINIKSDHPGEKILRKSHKKSGLPLKRQLLVTESTVIPGFKKELWKEVL